MIYTCFLLCCCLFNFWMLFCVLLHLDLWSILSYFCIWYGIGIQLHFSTCEYSSVPSPFAEKTVFPPTELLWQPCQISIGHKYEGCFPDSQFNSIGLYVYPILYCLFFLRIVHLIFLFLILFYLFIYLAAPDLSCSMPDLLVVACKLLVAACELLVAVCGI